MDHRVPRVGVLVSVLLALLAALSFVFLNSRFEGPADPLGALSGETRLTAVFVNTKRLPTKQPVLFKGLQVGRVKRVDWLPGRRAVRVTFALDRNFGLHADAVVRIGERSLLGDPFLDIVTRGSRPAPAVWGGGAGGKTGTGGNFDGG